MEKAESKEMKLREERSVDMFSKLPLEVTNNILLRLPFKSVAKGRNSNNETALTYIEETDENTFSKNPVKPFKVHDYDYVKNTFGWLIKIWGSCNGFVCLSRINLFNPSLPENPFYVFNPITGECIELPHLEVLDGEEIKKSEKSAVCSSGFGFDESKQEFKVVLVMFTQCESDTPAVDSEVKIYTLGSPSWRKKTWKWCRFLRVEGVKKVKDGSKLLAHPLVGSLISLKSAYGLSKRSTSDKEKDISLADMMFYMASLASVHQFAMFLYTPSYNGSSDLNLNSYFDITCSDYLLLSGLNSVSFSGNISFFEKNEESTKSSGNQLFSRLPTDLTTDIFSRLPSKSVSACKCVCKPWLHILSHPSFSKAQLAQLSKLSSDILVHFKALSPSRGGSRIYILEDNATIAKRPVDPLALFDEDYLGEAFDDEYGCPLILGSCNGFICLLSNPTTIRSFLIDNYFIPQSPVTIYVFNPITKEYSKLPSFNVPKLNYQDNNLCEIDIEKQTDRWLSGFGYVQSRNEMKVVVVLLVVRKSVPKVFDSVVYVHTLGSNVWRRKVGIAPNVLLKTLDISPSAVVNGSLHWLAIDQWTKNNGRPVIVSFDLDREGFGFVPTPESKKLLEFPYKGYNLGVFEEYLSVMQCFSYPADKIDIWVMKKYNVEGSWVKQFSFKQSLASRSSSFDTAKLIKVRNNGELLILCNSMDLVSYNVKTQKRKLIQVGWDGKSKSCYVPEVHTLVSSLISLQGAFGMESETFSE
ncbi:hypothetical protein IFM89_019677 [Coptis chinensis]|uniref:F-box domain-containing protein n=1 Tax=Coptis chinensis TaxID=261450 RepID=A0A835LS32_9MAGN|nr:hypothetical protein IFM89_019677 [Coptis chinensis]